MVIRLKLESFGSFKTVKKSTLPNRV
jgi:hypothetical protein